MSSFMRQILYEAHIFLIRRIIQDLGAIFPEKRSWCFFSLTLLYSHEYTFHHCCGTGPSESPLPRPGKRSSAGRIMSNSGRFP
jgi:hypothetical protein